MLEALEARVAMSTFAVQVFDDGQPVTGTTTYFSSGNLTLLNFSASSQHFTENINVSSITNSPGDPAGAILSLGPHSQATATTTGTHVLEVDVTSTDFSLPAGSPLVLSSSAVGEYAGGGSATGTYQGFVDPNNAAFGQPAGDGTPVLTASATGPINALVYTTPTNPSNPGTAIGTVVRTGTLFSMTDVAVFTINAAGSDVVNLVGTTTAAPPPSITTTPSTTQLPAPDLDVLKVPDQTVIQGGQQAGFTIRVYNEGTGTATGVTVTDALPAGLGNDINWMIDTAAAGTNPGDFTIAGAVGSQVLTLSSAFSGPPTSDSLTPGSRSRCTSSA
jgi:uncharacterized repeat protein (TIGR01451 family)